MRGTMIAQFRFHRDMYKTYVVGSGHFGAFLPAESGYTAHMIEVATTRAIVRAMLKGTTRRTLFDAAWRKALEDQAIDPSMPIFKTDSPTALIREAEESFRILESYISEMVNNPKSKFYIYG